MTLKLRCFRRICQVVCASLNVMRPMFLSDIQRREGCCDDTFSVSWQMPAKCVKCLNEHPSMKPLFWGFLCAQDGEVIHSLASRLLPLKIKLFFKFYEMGCPVFWTGVHCASHQRTVGISCVASCSYAIGAFAISLPHATCYIT